MLEPEKLVESCLQNRSNRLRPTRLQPIEQVLYQLFRTSQLEASSLEKFHLFSSEKLLLQAIVSPPESPVVDPAISGIFVNLMCKLYRRPEDWGALPGEGARHSDCMGIRCTCRSTTGEKQ